jgi:hypothetical protein
MNKERKFLFASVALLCILMMIPSMVYSAPVADLTTLKTYNGQEYAYANVASTWTEANSFTSDGWHLVVINSLAENEWLAANFGSYAWIGLYCIDGNVTDVNKWQWVDGTTPSSNGFIYWQGNQPDGGSDDRYATMNFPYYPNENWGAHWGNVPDPGYGSTPIAIFERVAPVPVPAAVWLLGSGMLGLVGLRRRLLK